MTKEFQTGFSLAELAVVLVIVAVLSAGAISTLRAQTERARFAEARALNDETRDALLNYAAVTGALPCPDISFDGSQGNPAMCGTGVQHGWVPWKTLGLPKTDPWGQPLHYAVHPTFTKATTIALDTKSTIGVQRQLADGSTELLGNADSVVMALWSSGPDARSKTTGSPSNTVFAEAPDSDDVVTWLSRFVLVGRMLEAGRDVPQTVP